MSIVEASPRRRSVSVEIGGKEITFETGKLAKQADGAVVVRSGDTMVLATAQGRTEGREGADFFPLTSTSRSGCTPPGRSPAASSSARAAHRARDPDRAHDRPPDPAALAEGLPQRGAVHLHRAVGRPGHAARHPRDQRRSAALMISPLPFLGPIGAVRIGRSTASSSSTRRCRSSEETSTST
jgi:polyribonucleotide nucleotidyltransferase